MSQEILFLLFLFFEGALLIALYQLYLVPKVISPAVVEHWLAEIESGRIHLPKVLESYTGELLGQVDALFFGWEDGDGNKNRGKIQKFYEGAAGAAAKSFAGDETGLAANMMKELAHEPWWMQALAQRALPMLQRAGENLPTPPVTPAEPSYNPGLNRK